ncbi:taste receptor type 2 member 4-like [Pelodytes ibericus]
MSVIRTMHSQAVLFLSVINLIEMAVGILLNAFIILMNFIWWLEGRSVQSIDLILCSLGFARLFLLVMYVIYDSILLIWLHDSKYLLQIYFTTEMFVGLCCLWISSLLCVFYCVKITNYSHRFFLYLKLNISRLVPRLLLASVTISFLSSLPCAWIVDETGSNSTNTSSTFYNAQSNVKIHYISMSIIYCSGSLVPIIIFCTAISLLIGSLLSHTSRMKSMNAGFRNPRLEALTSAVRNMLSFMFFYLIYIGSMCSGYLNMHYGNIVGKLISFIVINAYPSLHSIVLILSHARLNQVIRRGVQLILGKIKPPL